MFVEYDRSPEARYPVAIEQAYATAQWITAHGADEGLDASRLAVAGDSVGGNMAAAVAIMAKQRGDVTFCHQSLYYPVTDAAQDTASYREFADGPFLLAKSMAWFWDAYLPDESKRAEITASPLRATLEELAGLPEAFVIVDENDVLRDEGEAYARRLIEAGVRTTTVRYNAHDPRLHDAQPAAARRPRAPAPSSRQSTSSARRSAPPDRQHRPITPQESTHEPASTHRRPRPRRVRRVRELERRHRAAARRRTSTPSPSPTRCAASPATLPTSATSSPASAGRSCSSATPTAAS